MATFSINFPADIGDSLYYVDYNMGIVYPMVVFQIKKNRHIGDFVYDLVVDGETWDQKLTASVTTSEFGQKCFTTLYEAENSLKTHVEERDVFRRMLQTANSLKEKHSIKVISDTGEKIPAELLNVDFMCLPGVFHLKDSTGKEYYFDPKDIGTKLFLE